MRRKKHKHHSISANEFLEAANKGNNKRVKLFISQNKNNPDLIKLINETRDEKYKFQSALYAAASNGHKAVVATLIKAGADLEKSSFLQEDTPIVAATRAGHCKVMKKLLDAGAQAHHVSAFWPFVTDYYYSALFEAALYDQVDAAKLLLDDPFAKSMINTPFNVNENFNGTGDFGLTPLIAACQKNHVGFVNLLIEEGADVNLISPQNESAALTAALLSRIDCTSALDALIKAGVNVNQPLVNHEAPIFIPIFYNRPHQVKLLLNANVDLNVRNREGRSPLEYAEEIAWTRLTNPDKIPQMIRDEINSRKTLESQHNNIEEKNGLLTVAIHSQHSSLRGSSIFSRSSDANPQLSNDTSATVTNDQPCMKMS